VPSIPFHGFDSFVNLFFWMCNNALFVIVISVALRCGVSFTGFGFAR